MCLQAGWLIVWNASSVNNIQSLCSETAAWTWRFSVISEPHPTVPQEHSPPFQGISREGAQALSCPRGEEVVTKWNLPTGATRPLETKASSCPVYPGYAPSFSPNMCTYIGCNSRRSAEGPHLLHPTVLSTFSACRECTTRLDYII